MAFLLLAGAGYGRGEEPRQIWVPEAELKMVLEKYPRAIPISAVDYEALLERAVPEDGVEEMTAQWVPDPMVESAEGVGEVIGEMVEGEVRYQLRAFESGWREVLVAVPSSRIATVEADERVVVGPVEDGVMPVLVRGEGVHALKLVFQMSVAAKEGGGRSVLFPPVQASRAVFRLKVGEAKSWFSSGGFKMVGANEVEVVIPGQGAGLEVGWSVEDAEVKSVSGILQVGQTVHYVEGDRLQSDVLVRLRPELGLLPKVLRFALQGGDVDEVTGSGVQGWQVKDEGELAIEIGGGRSRELELRIRLSTMLGEEGGSLELPVLHLRGVTRSEGRLVVLGSPEIWVSPLNLVEGYRDGAVCSWSDHPYFVASAEYDSEISSAVGIDYRAKVQRKKAQLDTRVKMDAVGITFERDLLIQADEGDVFVSKLSLMTGEQVELVEGGRLERFEVKDGVLTLFWRGGITSGDVAEVAVRSRLLPGRWMSWGEEGGEVLLEGSTVEGAQTRGYLMVEADGVSVTTVGVQGLEARDGRRTPLKGALAWHAVGEYQARLRVKAQAATYGIYSTGYVSVSQGQLNVVGQVDVTTHGSAVRELLLVVDPAVADQVRFLGDEVAGQRSDLKTGEVRVELVRPLVGHVSLPWQMEIPWVRKEGESLVEFSGTLQPILAPEAVQMGGQWLVEESQGVEIGFEGSKARRIGKVRIPFLEHVKPVQRVVAAFAYQGKGDVVKLQGSRHPSAPATGVVVKELKMRSHVGATGVERHEWELLVHGGKGQSLGLKLPTLAVPLEVTVDGREARTQHESGNVLRIPFEDGGELMKVWVSFDLQAQEWGEMGRGEVAHAQLEDGVPILRTEWDVILPVSYGYNGFQTDLNSLSFEQPRPVLEQFFWKALPRVKGWVPAWEPWLTQTFPEPVTKDVSLGVYGGVVHSFEGNHAPDLLKFRYDTMKNKVRYAWIWFLLGMVVFWVVGRSKPLVLGLFGMGILTFLPMAGLTNLYAVANGLFMGWTVATVFGVLWSILDGVKWMRLRMGRGRSFLPGAGHAIWGVAVLGVALVFVESSRSEELGVVIVPYAEEADLEEIPSRYFIDYPAFERLWVKAAVRESGLLTGEGKVEEIPQGLFVVQSLHKGQLEEDRIEVEARYQVVAGRGSSRLPFELEGGTVLGMQLNGEGVSWEAGGIPLPGEGRHLLTVKYLVPLAENWKEVRWKVPGATAGALVLEVPADVEVPSWEGSGVVMKQEGGLSTMTRALGAGEFGLVKEVPEVVTPYQKPKEVDVHTVFEVRPGGQRMRSRIEFRGIHADDAQLKVSVPKPFALLRLNGGEGLKSWTWEDDGGSSGVLNLQVGGSREFALEMEAEAPLRPLPVDAEGPVLGVEGVKVTQTLVFGVDRRLVVETADLGVFQSLEEEVGGITEGLKVVGAFGATQDGEGARWKLSGEPVKENVEVDYVYQLGEGRTEVFVRMRIEGETKKREVEMGLPKGVVVEWVKGEALERWRQDGEKLAVVLEVLEGGGYGEVVMGLVKNENGGVLPALQMPEGWAFSGTALVVGQEGFDYRLEAPGVKEVELGEVSPDVKLLSPMERKHAFSFSEGKGEWGVEQEVIEANYKGSTVLAADVSDTWVKLAYHIGVEVGEGAVEVLRFTVPAEVPEFRWTCGCLREVQSEVTEEGVRRYAVFFQEPVTGKVRLQADAEILMKEGGTQLPRLVLDGANQERQYLVLKQRSRSPLEINTRNVLEVARAAVPYLPMDAEGSRFYRLQTAQWFFGVGLAQRSESAGMEALVTVESIRSAVRETGEEWHEVTYRVFNQSMQFLQVVMDRDAQLVTVWVDGEEVQADKGGKRGKQDVLLVPLPLSAAGEKAYDVQLVYRVPSDRRVSLDERVRLEMKGPELLDVSVEESFWDLYLPRGYQMKGESGNVYEISRETQDVHLLESDLRELTRLSSLARSKGESAWTKTRASREVAALSDSMKERIAQSSAKEGMLRSRLQKVEQEVKKLRAMTAFPEQHVFQPGERGGPEVKGATGGTGFVENELGESSSDQEQGSGEIVELSAQERWNDFVLVRPELTTSRVGFDGEMPSDLQSALEQEQWTEGFEFAVRWGAQDKVRGAKELPKGRMSLTTLPVVASPVRVDSEGGMVREEDAGRGVEKEEVRALSFPVEGEPIRFRKLKGGAELELEARRGWERSVILVWVGFGVFLLLLLILNALGNRMGTRSGLG